MMNPLSDLQMELSNTRKALERVPDDKLDFKPHPKSGTLIWLASHVADIPGWGSYTLNSDGMEFDGMQPPPLPGSREELLAKFDRNAAELTAAMAGADDAKLAAIWTGTMKGKPVLAGPKGDMLRGMIMNHMIHHRAQLTVYLRLLDIPVPALYGPSADEGNMFGEASA
ncbi:MAG TPA: DinB family protein [Bryobacteraceae bacterium]|nr:DinB family protein [Bryobacteraceae bacterium]